MHSETHSITVKYILPLAVSTLTVQRRLQLLLHILRVTTISRDLRSIYLDCTRLQGWISYLSQALQEEPTEMTLTISSRNVVLDKTRIPTPNLPPPYTWNGTRAGQLRYVSNAGDQVQ